MCSHCRSAPTAAANWSCWKGSQTTRLFPEPSASEVSLGVARIKTSRDGSHQNGGGAGCTGFGPNARAVSRCGRLILDIASCPSNVKEHHWDIDREQSRERI